MNLSSYYEQICKEPILTAEEEQDLFKELGDDGIPESRKVFLRERIIKANLRFVFKQAKKSSKNDPELFAELIAAGNEGLLVGLKKYKPSVGTRFLSYAGFWVTQRILKHMSTLRIVSLPIYKQQLAAKIQRYVDSHENPSVEEVVNFFPDIPAKDIKELLQTKYLTYYIEDLKDDPAFQINPIEDYAEVKMEVDRIHQSVDSLPRLHKEVMHLTFGLKDGEELKVPEIASTLGISKEAVKKLKKEALEMLAEKISPDSLSCLGT